MENSEIPRIVEKLLLDDGKKMRPYFRIPMETNRDDRIWARISKVEDEQRADKWISAYRKKVESNLLDHDEPWLTLVALYGIFGDQIDLSNERVTMLNGLFKEVFGKRLATPDPPQFEVLEGAYLEVKLPEILLYRKYVHQTIFRNEAYHPYPDTKRTIETKLKSLKSSIEGNTNLDALISGKTGGRHIHIFIEAKFMSDISKDIKYVPVRNQIARTIDCAIDLVSKGGRELDQLENFWFLLLTPGIFRTEGYGGSLHNPFEPFCPDRGRLYCYKMNDYLTPANLQRDLPHWKDALTDQHWAIISSHIGWLTFEEIVSTASSGALMSPEEIGDYNAFFHERSMHSL